MDDVRQIIVGGQKTGILGLKDALEATADQCQGKADDHIKIKTWIEQASSK